MVTKINNVEDDAQKISLFYIVINKSYSNVRIRNIREMMLVNKYVHIMKLLSRQHLNQKSNLNRENELVRLKEKKMSREKGFFLGIFS